MFYVKNMCYCQGNIKEKYFFIILKYLFVCHPFNLSVHHMHKVNDTSIMLIVCLDFI